LPNFRIAHNPLALAAERNYRVCHPELSAAQPKDLRLLFVCSIQTVPEKRVTSEFAAIRQGTRTKLSLEIGLCVVFVPFTFC
jgi:hypothetical protein